MAHYRDKGYIAGRLVKVATGTYGQGTSGRTQTVNVCKPANTEGDYEQVYRLPTGDHPLTVSGLQAAAGTLGDLDAYLVGLGAVREGPR